MLTKTRQTKACEIERILSIAFNSEAGCVEATVCETHHKKTKSISVSFTSYFLRRIAADFGQGYEVEKRFHGGEVYHVHHDRGSVSCTCPGGTYRGSCRHMEMIAEAKKQQLL